MLNPKKLTKDNAEEIKELLKHSENYMSLAKFPTLFLWHEYTELKYDIKTYPLSSFRIEDNFSAIFLSYNDNLSKPI